MSQASWYPQSAEGEDSGNQGQSGKLKGIKNKNVRGRSKTLDDSVNILRSEEIFLRSEFLSKIHLIYS